MESHEVREENVVLRQRVEQVETKLREVLVALEKRNSQVREWASMYEEMQGQFQEAQASADTQAGFVQERNVVIQRLNEMITELRQRNYQQSAMATKAATKLGDEVYQHKMYLIETLNKISNEKIPAEEKFAELENLMNEKNAKIKGLEDEFNELKVKYETLGKAMDERDSENERLQRINEENVKQITCLHIQLDVSRSGRHEQAEIEELKFQLREYHQKLIKSDWTEKRLKKRIQKLKEMIKQHENTMEQMNDNLEGVIDQNVALRERNREQQNKVDETAEYLSKSRENERKYREKLQAKELEANKYAVMAREFEARLGQQGQKKTQIAVRRMKEIKHDGDVALKNRETKLQLRQEMEKRLDAEQAVFDMKDEMAALKKEVVVAKEMYAEAKGADVNPLIELLRDLQVEAIAVDGEYYELMEAIPETPDRKMPEIPDAMCQSDAYICSQAIAIATQHEIENKELRILLDRFARAASMYHRIASVIGKYPILSSEDIATYQDRGNWVLPADVEHLQRAVVKLHEVLMRRKT